MIEPSIFEDSNQLHRAAAEHWISSCSAAVQARGYFHVALSGGSTPKALFQLLTTPEYSKRIQWEKIHFYFGDERFVPHDHVDSNYRMAKLAMLDHVPCKPANIHAVNTNLPNAAEAAKDYTSVLQSTLPADKRFDLVLLGLGPDGHTASLFPGTAALKEKTKICTEVFVEKFKSWRISITFPMINSARQVLLLSEGDGKADIIYDLLVTAKNKEIYPVQLIVPQGKMHWYIDKAAAKKLS